MDVFMYDDDDHPYVPFGVSLAAVLLVALLSTVVTVLLTRGSRQEVTGGAVGANRAVGTSTVAHA